MEPEGPSKPQHLLLKALSGVFALIIAPMLVAIGGNLVQKKLETAVEEPAKGVAAGDAKKDAGAAESRAVEKPHATAKKAKGVLAKAHVKKHAPPTTLRLFNGRDLAGFYTFLGPKAEGEPPIGKDKDGPHDRVFYVRDGLLHITGRLRGALVTDDAYEDYHLTVEYRWGQRTHYGKSSHRPRSSGIVLHGEGDDGTVRDAWMPGVQVEIVEHRTGDFFLFTRIPKVVTMKVEAEEKTAPTADGKGQRVAHVYTPGAPATPFKRGAIHRLGATPFEVVPPESEPYEKPRGEWNTLECICVGRTITVLLNGKKVNHATDVSRGKGKILFLSEGAEIAFRRIDLKMPVTEAADVPAG